MCNFFHKLSYGKWRVKFMKKIFNEKTISFLNKYSLAFHALLACTIVFFVEVISRRDFLSACSFVGTHTLAFL